MADRLAAYEDTGMEPEEVKDLQLEVTALKTIEAMYDGLGHPDHLRHLVEAEKAGRLVVLPCDLHKPLYIIKNGEVIREYGVQWHFTDRESQTFGTLSLYGGFVRINDFGKTVFLTREEAETALEAMKGGSYEADSV